MHFLGFDKSKFPDGETADEQGIWAVGGDLSPERLIHAYRRGIFPWYSEGLPILWHCPNPRFVLEPKNLHVPKSLKKTIRKSQYRVTCDVAFEQVIDGCAKTKRPGQGGTWITRDMRKAYVLLHELGYAQSVESWDGDQFVGGLYGVSVGQVFFGESMFSKADDASKVAFVVLVEWMKTWGVQLIDCQQETEHLKRFGAEPWDRKKFVSAVAQLGNLEGKLGRWSIPETFPSSL